MPDGVSTCRQPAGRLRQFERFMADGGAGGKDNKKVKFIDLSDSGYESIDISQVDVRPRFPTAATTDSTPKKPRAKESSRHFGVRFRPDLQKWVAEIRVFEWKSVDKKVWLGTFDTEQGAARAVDAARKLLRCKKKRLPNFPCAALSAYNESIPSHLQLTNITEEGMFKEVTVYVKRKAQEYAAGFGTSKGATAVGLREQLVAPQYQIHAGDGNGCFHLTSNAESRQLFTVLEDDLSPTGYSPTSYGTNKSYGSYGAQFPSCDGVMLHHWGSPSSTTYSSGPSSCSSLGASPVTGTSPVDESWVQVQPSMWTEQSHMWSQESGMGDYCLVAPTPLQGSWENQTMSVPMGMDDQSTIEMEDMEYLFNMEDMGDDQEGLAGGDQAINPIMDVFLGDEVQVGAQVMYIDNHYGNWTFQQSFNTTYSLSSSFENKEVC